MTTKIWFRFEKALGDAAAVAPPNAPADAKALVLVRMDGSIMYFATVKAARSTAREAKRLGIEAHLAVREVAS